MSRVYYSLEGIKIRLARIRAKQERGEKLEQWEISEIESFSHLINE